MRIAVRARKMFFQKFIVPKIHCTKSSLYQFCAWQIWMIQIFFENWQRKAINFSRALMSADDMDEFDIAKISSLLDARKWA